MAKTVERVVVHPKLYLAVEKKLQHVQPGTKLTLTLDQVEQLGSKVADPADVESIDATDGKGAAVINNNDKAMTAMGDELQKLQNANAALQAEINKLQKK